MGPSGTYLSWLGMPPQQWKGPDKKPAAPGLERRSAYASAKWQSRVALKREKCAQPNTAWHRLWHAKASGSLVKLWPNMSSGNQATSSSKQIAVAVDVVLEVMVLVVRVSVSDVVVVVVESVVVVVVVVVELETVVEVIVVVAVNVRLELVDVVIVVVVKVVSVSVSVCVTVLDDVLVVVAVVGVAVSVEDVTVAVFVQDVNVVVFVRDVTVTVVDTVVVFVRDVTITVVDTDVVVKEIVVTVTVVGFDVDVWAVVSSDVLDVCALIDAVGLPLLLPLLLLLLGTERLEAKSFALSRVPICGTWDALSRWEADNLTSPSTSATATQSTALPRKRPCIICC